MASIDFSPALCEQLHSVPKYLASRIEWKADGPRKFIFLAKVLTEDGTGLDLSGYWMITPEYDRRRWGFNLMYFGNCVRMYDMATYHKNPGGGKIRGPHKHKFASSKIPRLAYKPDPLICEDDTNSALIDFLKEENIELRKPYQTFIFP